MNAHAPAPGNIAALPPALARMVAEHRWVVWRWQDGKSGKRTKVPYDADRIGSKASSTDPKTWGSYSVARDVVLAGLADGIGYCLHGGDVAAFDLDDAIAEDGSILTWAWNLIDECGSYTERTISGTGLRILGTAAGAKVHRKQKIPGTPSSLETYRVAERYIVITGAALEGFGGELQNIDAPVDRWVAKLDDDKAAEREADRAARQKAKGETIGERFAAHVERVRVYADSNLPRDLEDLIRYGAPEGARSDKFFHAVGWLKDRGHSPGDIEQILSAYPDGIAAKFMDRLRPEIERAYDKADTKSRATGGLTARDDGFGSSGTRGEPPKLPALIWYGDKPPEPPPWLVRDLLPQSQTAITAGVFSSGKTFVVGDLAVCVMLAVPFAGREVVRPGAVLWLAAEGANEIDARIKAAAVERAADGEPAALPFARQAFDVPKLTAPEAEAQILALVEAFKVGLAERFPAVDPVMIVVDTIGSAAGFTDANGQNEPQSVFNMLRRVSTKTGALVLVVDHFGKVAETGVMGSATKAQSADAVLAILCDKSIEGEITNRRLAVHKQRAGGGGLVIPFKLRQVALGGFDGTTCVVDWQEGVDPFTPSAKAGKPMWNTAAERTFKGCLERALVDHGSEQQPFGRGNAKVRAVPLSKVRDAFMSEYAADHEDRAKALDAKRNAFKRAREGAIRKGLVRTKEIGASLTDWIWLVKDEPEMDETDVHTDADDAF